MKTYIHRLFLIPVLLLATLSVQDGGQPASAGSPEPTPPARTSPSPPDFTNVSDILGGRCTLFPSDAGTPTQPWLPSFTLTLNPASSGAQ